MKKTIKSALAKTKGHIAKIQMTLFMMIVMPAHAEGTIINGMGNLKAIFIMLGGVVVVAVGVLGFIRFAKGISNLQGDEQQRQQTPKQAWLSIFTGLAMMSATALAAIVANDLGIQASSNSAINEQVFGQ